MYRNDDNPSIPGPRGFALGSLYGLPSTERTARFYPGPVSDGVGVTTPVPVSDGGGVPPSKVPLCQGVPRAGRSHRSNPIQPATFQARINRMPSNKRIGLLLVEPESKKLVFSMMPKNAAMPTSAPRIRPRPTNVSPTAIRGPNQVYAWLSSRVCRKLRHQS